MPSARASMARFVRSAVLNDAGLKVLSLFAAITMFVIARGPEQAQTQIAVEVLAVLPADNTKILVSTIPERVQLTLRGSQTLLTSLRRNGVDPVQVDLTDPHRRSYYFNSDAFGLPPGVAITQVEPPSIPLAWAERLERQVPVRVNVVGRAPSGLAIEGRAQVNPTKVTVYGPKSEVAALREVRTVAIDVSSLNDGSHELNVELERLGRFMSYLGDASVSVNLTLGPALSERRFVHLPVSALGQSNVRLRPSAVTVTVKGTETVVERLSEDDVVPVVETSELPAGVTPVAVSVQGLPEGLVVVSIQPAQVLVHVGR